MNEVKSFNSIYVEYAPVLRVIAVRSGLPYEEVDDIVQETFLSYFTHYPVDWDSGKMKGMLARILKNKCIDYARKKRPEVIELDENGADRERRYVNLLVPKDSLSIVLEQESHRKVWSTMKNMRADWLEVFVLYFIHDFPIREVSAKLGISVDACRTRISRGRKYLKEELHSSKNV